MLLCVLTALGGYGDHRGSQKSGPACFGPWPVNSPFPPFNSTVWTHPAPALSPGGSIFRRSILDFLWRLTSPDLPPQFYDQGSPQFYGI